MTQQGHQPSWTVSLAGRSHTIAIEPNPAFLRLLSALPGDVRGTLTPRQLAALASATVPRQSPHLLRYRVSIPWLTGRYYLTVYFGRERRSLDRLAAEGQLALGRISLVYGLFVLLTASLSAIGLIVVAYVIKSALGLDLFDGPSPLHDLFYFSEARVNPREVL